MFYLHKHCIPGVVLIVGLSEAMIVATVELEEVAFVEFCSGICSTVKLLHMFVSQHSERHELKNKSICLLRQTLKIRQKNSI